MISVVGLGGIGIIRDNIDFVSAAKLINYALDNGINFIETARSYEDSEVKIGKVMKERRKDCYLASKTLSRKEKQAWKDLNISLQKLQTDKIDLYQLHDVRSESDLKAIMAHDGALQALKRARTNGLIDFIGITGHMPEIIVRAIKTGEFDTIQIPYNPIDIEFFEDVIPIANELDLGIIIMKPLVGGLLKDADTALRFILSKSVSTVIPGMSSIEHVNIDVQIGNSISALTPLQEQGLFDEAEKLGKDFCRRCGYCVTTCPAGIPIPDIFRLERYKVSYYAGAWAKRQYRKLEINVNKCQDCGTCEERCPYELPVRQMLKRAHRELSRKDIRGTMIKILHKLKWHYFVRILSRSGGI